MSVVDEFLLRLRERNSGLPVVIVLAEYYLVIKMLAEKIVELSSEDDARRMFNEILESLEGDNDE